MKVVHVVTSINGGAGIAALRLHKSLLEQNVDSKILVLADGYYESSEIVSFLQPKLKKIIDKVLNRMYRHFNQAQYLNTVKSIVGQFEIFTTPKTLFKIEKHPLVREADIIHLHWIANFVNYETFFKSIGKSGKKIVWTFHDMNPFMGGFHYEGDKISNKQIYQIEASFLKLKIDSYGHVANNKLKIIYLNSWMKEKSASSKVFERRENFIIPNCLDFSEFKIVSKIESRKRLNIVPEKKVMLFGCQHISNRRKGFDLLFEALKELGRSRKDLLLITLGENMPQLDIGSIEVLNLGYISDKRMLSEVYSAADIFVLPSREDNLPNVMLEAWACGLPVISFANGGMREFVIDKVNGIIVPVIHSESLSQAISTGLDLHFEREKIRDAAKALFSPEIIASKVINQVYKHFQ